MLTLAEIRDLTRPYMECPGVFGVVLTGSYALGVPDELSDLDIALLADAPVGDIPKLIFPVEHEYWVEDEVQRHAQRESNDYGSASYYGCVVLHDQGGRARAEVDAYVRAHGDIHKMTWASWDSALNALYRALKYHRKRNEYGFRICSAETAMHLTRAIFTQNGYIAPLLGREAHALHVLSLRIMPDELLLDTLLMLAKAPTPERLSALYFQIDAFLRETGFGGVVDDWEGKVEAEARRVAGSKVPLSN